MIKKVFGLLFINLVLVLFQLSFFGEFFGNTFVPNLVIALAFALVFSGLGNLGKMSAFLGGLLLDLLGFNIIGFSPIVIISCMIMYDFIRKNVSGNLFVSALVVFVSTLIYDRILGFSPSLFSGEAVIGALLTVALCGIFYAFATNISSYFLKSGYKLSE